MIQIKEKFIPTEFGWISVKTPPVNHNNVVVLVWLKNETLYQELICFFENGNWELTGVDDEDYEIQGWYPLPYTPHNH